MYLQVILRLSIYIPYVFISINEQICKTEQKSSFHKPYIVFIRLTHRKM